jgi:hypothetical protein
VAVLEDLDGSRSALEVGEVRRRREVGEVGVLDQAVRDVDAEPVDAPVEPAAQDAVELLRHRGVAPVPVGLLRQEQVAPVLPGRLVEGPRGTAEVAGPVVRRAAVGCGVAPQVVVAVRAVARAAGRDEPRVLGGGVVRDEVDDHLEPQVMRPRHDGVERVEVAEDGFDVAVVGDVVAVVPHRRGVEGRDPDDPDAQPGEVVEPVVQTAEVTDAVTVAVGEGAEVDLVADAVGPPPLLGHQAPPQAERPGSAQLSRSAWAGTARTAKPYSPLAAQVKVPR